MNTWKVIFATLVIFVAGVVTGGLVVNYTSRARPHRPRPELASRGQTNSGLPRDQVRLPNLPNPLPQFLRRDFLQKLDHEVQLTLEQRDRIEKIVSEGQERNKELVERIAPEMRKEIGEVKERILEVLTPAQRPKFEELMKHPREQRRPAQPREGQPSDAKPQPPPSPEPPRNL